MQCHKATHDADLIQNLPPVHLQQYHLLNTMNAHALHQQRLGQPIIPLQVFLGWNQKFIDDQNNEQKKLLDSQKEMQQRQEAVQVQQAEELKKAKALLAVHIEARQKMLESQKEERKDQGAMQVRLLQTEEALQKAENTLQELQQVLQMQQAPHERQQYDTPYAQRLMDRTKFILLGFRRFLQSGYKHNGVTRIIEARHASRHINSDNSGLPFEWNSPPADVSASLVKDYICKLPKKQCMALLESIAIVLEACESPWNKTILNEVS